MTCHTSMWKMFGLLCLGGLTVGGSYFCTTLPQAKAQFFGWIGVVFFGACFAAIVMLLFRDSEQIVIDDVGILDRRGKIGLIRWADVTSISIGSIHGQKFLCLEVVDPERYLASLPLWKRKLAEANRALGFPPLAIGFTGLTPGIDEAWAYLRSRGIVVE